MFSPSTPHVRRDVTPVRRLRHTCRVNGMARVIVRHENDSTTAAISEIADAVRDDLRLAQNDRPMSARISATQIKRLLYKLPMKAVLTLGLLTLAACGDQGPP
jgi:hypothetical protein